MPQLSSRMPPQFPPQPPHPGPVDGFTSTDATTQMWRRHPDRDYPPALGTQSYYQQHDYGGGPDYFHDHPRDPSFLSRASTFLSNYIHCIMARRIVRTIVKVGVLVTVTISFLLYLDSHFRAVHEHVHAILPEHHDGIIVTDIAYLECNTINLVKTCAMDATQGWNRVEKDLYLGSGWTKTGYLYVQTKKEGEFKPETDKIVVDIKIGRKTPEPKDGAGDNNVMWEQRQLGLWVKRQKKLMQNTVTAVEVLYGPDAVEVREGWQLKDGSLNVGDLGLQPRLTICRGNPPKPVKPLVQLDKNHNLKIIQVAGMYFITGI